MYGNDYVVVVDEFFVDVELGNGGLVVVFFDFYFILFNFCLVFFFFDFLDLFF